MADDLSIDSLYNDLNVNINNKLLIINYELSYEVDITVDDDIDDTEFYDSLYDICDSWSDDLDDSMIQSSTNLNI